MVMELRGHQPEWNPSSKQDCEQRFADLFGDGCVVKVEPHVQAIRCLVFLAQCHIKG